MASITDASTCSDMIDKMAWVDSMRFYRQDDCYRWLTRPLPWWSAPEDSATVMMLNCPDEQGVELAVAPSWERGEIGVIVSSLGSRVTRESPSDVWHSKTSVGVSLEGKSEELEVEIRVRRDLCVDYPMRFLPGFRRNDPDEST